MIFPYKWVLHITEIITLKNKKFALIKGIIGWVFLIFITVLAFSMRWMLKTWSELTFEEVLFQLSTLQGTGNGMITQYIVGSILPAAILFAFVFLLKYVILKNNDKKKYIVPAVTTLGVAAFLFYLVLAVHSLGIISYIKGQIFPGTFIAEQYVDPKSIDIEFPEKKRNLIYIYMESGETTFADKENGGVFDENVIPELTKLAQENEDFSGTDNALNGGISLYGSTWTMAGIFAQTSGLPLRTGLGKNKMSTMESFAPDMTALGDILESNGYKQVYMIGSPAVFGGRDMYFTEHGNFELQDYYYMKDNGKIPEDYYVFWGFEDLKLFDFAKEELTTLSQNDEPFNLTLLTVDTHFEDGYVCEKCENKFSEQYSNVYACASKQITEFVNWVKQQDFYENTTIVISGDHPTMDQNYCLNVDKNYQRKVYTAYINAAAEPETTEKRTYSTFDAFPTTVAALGCTIEGNRLGLGTNLFSSEQTLLEKYGKPAVNSYLKERSEFLTELMGAKPADYENYTFTENATVDVTKQSETLLDVEISNLLEVGEGIESFTLYVRPTDSSEETAYPMTYDGFSTYKATIDTSGLPNNYGHLRAIAKSFSGEEYQILDLDTDIYLLSETYVDYLGKLKEYLDAGKNISVLIVAHSDASSKLTSPMKKAMKAIGLTTNFSNLDKQSYYGIIDQGSVTENISRGYLTYNGTLKNGTAYKLNSGGYFAGSTSHIIMNNLDYSRGIAGFNYLIYDNDMNSIINTVGYNTRVAEPDVDLKMVSYDKATKQLTMKVSEIKGVRKWTKKGNTIIKYFNPDDQSTLDFTVMDMNQEDKTFSATIDLAPLNSDRIQFQVNSVGIDGKVRVTESITSLEFLEHYEVGDYLDYLNKRDDIAVFMAVKNTGTHALDDTAKNKLQELGLSSTATFGADTKKCGYAAIIDNHNVVLDKQQETTKGENVVAEGTLSNGASYSVTSAGANTGAVSHIYIDGTDYSLNRKGLDIVVYDLKKGQVVDTVVINATGEYIASR